MAESNDEKVMVYEVYRKDGATICLICGKDSLEDSYNHPPLPGGFGFTCLAWEDE